MFEFLGNHGNAQGFLRNVRGKFVGTRAAHGCYCCLGIHAGVPPHSACRVHTASVGYFKLCNRVLFKRLLVFYFSYIDIASGPGSANYIDIASSAGSADYIGIISGPGPADYIDIASGPDPQTI